MVRLIIISDIRLYADGLAEIGGDSLAQSP